MNFLFIPEISGFQPMFSQQLVKICTILVRHFCRLAYIAMVELEELGEIFFLKVIFCVSKGWDTTVLRH